MSRQSVPAFGLPNRLRYDTTLLAISAAGERNQHAIQPFRLGHGVHGSDVHEVTVARFPHLKDSVSGAALDFAHPQGNMKKFSYIGTEGIAKGKRIRDVKRLVTQYGGRASQWVKKSSPQFEVAGASFEYHWYEHHGVGRFETKQVRVS